MHVALASACTALGWYYGPSMQLPLLLGWLAAVGCVAGAGWYLLVSMRRSMLLRAHIRQRLLLGLLWGGFAFFVDAQWPGIVVALLNATLIAAAMLLLRVRAMHPVAYAALVAPALLIFGGSVSMLGSDLSAALVVIDLAMVGVLVLEARHIAAIAGNRAVLLNKTQELEERLRWTTGAFQDQQLRAKREEALARQVFDRLTRQKHQDLREISSWVCANGSFSGDLLLHSQSPSGNLNLLFCDFTGHGLPAALGAIPVSGMFHTMTQKEYSPLDIAREMNGRLASMLPADYFCCACLLRITPDRRRMEVSNAGLPPLLVVDGAGEIKSRYRSQLLPLGIHHSHPFVHQETVTLAEDDVVYLYSDGLIESENLYGEMFGLARLEQQLCRPASDTGRIGAVRDAVEEFIGAGEPIDDISLIELKLEHKPVMSNAEVA
ncbi:MAG: serine/threonine-protein phosphatase [Gammaproteobacteria bacterium]|nr:serine/threonine-protein phosphatase [Gammaproteobacteria bacterium]